MPGPTSSRCRSRPPGPRSGPGGRLQARYNRLVRRFGGGKNPGARKKAILAIAHTLLKIACQVLRTGTPYQDLGADFCTRRESPEHKQAFLERQLQNSTPAAPSPSARRPAGPRRPPEHPPPPFALIPRRLRSRRPPRHPGPPAGQPSRSIPDRRPATVRCRAPAGTQFPCQRGQDLNL